MPCPNYEGNHKCAFKDVSYVLSVEHVANYCVSQTNNYESCEILVQVQSARKKDSTDLKGLEEAVRLSEHKVHLSSHTI